MTGSAGADATSASWVPPFIIASVFWGSSFLFIELALDKFSPSQVAFGRVAVGALVLAGMVLVGVVRGGRRLPRFTWRQILAIAAVGAALSGLPFILIPAAQQHITSILASLLNATTPLWTALFVALIIPKERASRAQWLGLLLGIVGIAILLGAWDVDDFPVWGAVLMLGATACYGIGSTLSRLYLTRIKEGPVAISSAQISLSALMLLPFAFVGGSPDAGAFAWSSSAMWGLLLLGVLGTSFAYVMFYRVITIAGATAGASVTYAVPVVATLLGVLVLGEHLLWHEPVGAVVVLVGVWLAQRKPTKTGAITTT